MLKMSHLYLSEPKSLEFIEEWCVQEDYDHALKFKNKQRQNQSLAGRCLVRMLYSCFWATTESDLKIIVGENGKPLIRSSLQSKALWVSISHSNDFVCAILSDHCSVGIDSEHIKANRDITTLVHKLYSSFKGSEIGAYKFWTLNEAYGKAKGVGVDFSQADTIYQTISSKKSPPQSLLFKTMMVDDYMVSVCCL
ncbi:4'-phosphopantetheinyl transferase family protein [Terasakiella sp.]|uniref:4'-phosphopantetheinyl transferase family protein n=1 Tax=Terasakiella sp. TaxID=2034861 RepID=UPI003AA7F1C3